jgi:hypothetical protein
VKGYTALENLWRSARSITVVASTTKDSKMEGTLIESGSLGRIGKKRILILLST